MRRRSVSSFVSPGPRVPIPPPRRDSEWPWPESRGSMYFNCASSTCRRPSAVRARRANISRINCVRSMTLMPNSAFEIALLRGREFVIDDQDVGLASLRQFFQFLYFAVSEQSGRIENGTDLKHLGNNLQRRRWRPVRQVRERIRTQPKTPIRGGVRSPRGSPSPGAAPVKSSDPSPSAAVTASRACAHGDGGGCLTDLTRGPPRAAEWREWSRPSKWHA